MAKGSDSAIPFHLPANVMVQPRPEQAAAGNYQHLHREWNGLPISIETVKGGTRTDKHGQWSVPDFPADYGRFKGTIGGDGEHVDLFMGDHPESPHVFVLDQIDPKTGKWDEHKVLTGYESLDQAVAAYDSSFSDGSGPSRRGKVTEMTVPELKEWLKTEGTKSEAHPQFVLRKNLEAAIAKMEPGTKLTVGMAVRAMNEGGYKAAPKDIKAEFARMVADGRLEKKGDSFVVPDRDMGTFILSSSGSPDLGHIDATIAKEIGREAAPIRIRSGDRSSGLEHIESGHGDQARQRGYKSALDLVTDVIANFDAIYPGKGRALILAKRTGMMGHAYVQLEPSKDGAFYDVKTATPSRESQFKNKKPLWERAGPSASAAEAVTVDPSIQSGRASVTATGRDSKPQTKTFDAGWGAVKQRVGILTRARDQLLKKFGAGRLAVIDGNTGKPVLRLKDGTPDELKSVQEEVDRQTQKTIDKSQAAAAKGKPPREFPETLNEWIAKKGGVTDNDGDLAGQGLGTWHIGRFSKPLIHAATPEQKALFADKGMERKVDGHDDLVTHAIEEHFLPEGSVASSDTNDLYREMVKDAGATSWKDRVYRSTDSNRVHDALNKAANDEHGDWDEGYAHHIQTLRDGIDAYSDSAKLGLSDREKDYALEYVREGMSLGDAVDMAIEQEMIYGERRSSAEAGAANEHAHENAEIPFDDFPAGGAGEVDGVAGDKPGEPVRSAASGSGASGEEHEEGHRQPEDAGQVTPTPGQMRSEKVTVYEKDKNGKDVAVKRDQGVLFSGAETRSKANIKGGDAPLDFGLFGNGKEEAPAHKEEQGDIFSQAEKPKTTDRHDLLGDNFVRAPDGSMDFGAIPEEAEKETAGVLKAKPIRLQVGNEDGFGADHLKTERVSRIKAMGFSNVGDYVEYVAKNFNEVWLADGGRPLLAVSPGRGEKRGKSIDNLMVVELRDEGGFYGVTTIIPDAGPIYKTNAERKLVWERNSTPASSDVGSSEPVGPVAPEQVRGETGGGLGQTSDVSIGDPFPGFKDMHQRGRKFGYKDADGEFAADNYLGRLSDNYDGRYDCPLGPDVRRGGAPTGDRPQRAAA